MSLLNHYSYALAAGVLLLWLGIQALRRRTPLSLAVLAAVALVSIGFNVALRTNAADLTGDDLGRAIADGRPTLVEFYSEY